MIIHHYETLGGKDLILDYIMGLSKPEIIDGLSVLDKFKNDEMDKLNIKPWQGKVWEVYFYKHNRIFYVVVEDTDVYMLHACRKQKNKTERKDSEIVVKRAKELSNVLSKKLYSEVLIMPFKQVDINNTIQKALEADPELKQMWKESRTEYQVLGELVKIRKEKGLSQVELAEKSGNKQQVISRIENKENSPTLKTLCSILDVLGYDIKFIPRHRA